MVGDLLADSLVRAVMVLVSDIFCHHLLQIPAVENEGVVQAFPPQTAHEAFTNRIGFGRSERGFQLLDT
jgi:hypothetical protein